MRTRMVVAVGAALLALGGCTSPEPVETTGPGVRTVTPTWSGDVTQENWGAQGDPADQVILDGYGIDPEETRTVAATVRGHGLEGEVADPDYEEDQTLVVDVISECSFVERGERTWSELEDGVQEKRGLSTQEANGLMTYLRDDFCPGLSTDLRE